MGADIDAKIKIHNKVISSNRILISCTLKTHLAEQYDEIRRVFLAHFKDDFDEVLANVKDDFDEVKGRSKYDLDTHIIHFTEKQNNWLEYGQKYSLKTIEVKKLFKKLSLECKSELIVHTSGYLNKKDIVEPNKCNLDYCLSCDRSDGNIDYCLACDRSDGDLISCDYCPRAYHRKCVGLKKNDLSNISWQCTMCKQKGRIMPDDVVEGKNSFKVISNAFSTLVTSCPGSETKLEILCKIYEMVQNLLKYDLGSFVAEPIKQRSCCQTITDPKDLGTISKNMLKGVYSQNILIRSSDNDDSAESVSPYAAFDKVILTVLNDVEKVWQNCFQCVKKETICYRMVQILRDKCYKICQENFFTDLSPYVKNGLQKYINECQEEQANKSTTTEEINDDSFEEKNDGNDQDINDNEKNKKNDEVTVDDEKAKENTTTENINDDDDNDQDINENEKQNKKKDEVTTDDEHDDRDENIIKKKKDEVTVDDEQAKEIKNSLKKYIKECQEEQAKETTSTEESNDDSFEQQDEDNDQDINENEKNKNKDEVTVDDEDDVVEINDDDENDDDDDDDYVESVDQYEDDDSFEQQDDDIDQDLTVDDEDDDKDEKKKRKRKTVVEIKYDDENDDDDDDDYVEKVDQYEDENHKKKENKKTKKIQDQIIQFENNNIQPKNKRVSYFYIIINCNDVNEYILTSFFVMLSITLKEYCER